MTHQTSPPVSRFGIVLVPPPIAPGGEQEVDHDVEAMDARPRGGPRCARCGRLLPMPLDLEFRRCCAGPDPLGVTRFCGLARLPTRRTVADWLRQFTQEP